MEIYIPTHIYIQQGCIEKNKSIFTDYGKKALIVTGAHSSKANGSLSCLESALKATNTNYIIFDEIEENPSIETVMKAREIGVENEIDFVIGLGGGSPLDAAKAIALMIANPSENADRLYDKKDLKHLPVIAIPTTAGTGSEVTPWSILTIHAKRTKSSIPYKIYPAVALIDPGYLKTMSRNTLISTAVDTLAHLIESYLVVKADDYTKAFSLAGLNAWGKFKDELLLDKMTDDGYMNMVIACTNGGMAIAHTSTGFPHALSYKLTYELGIPHGAACGITLSGFLNMHEDKQLVNNALSALGFCNLTDFKEYLEKLLPKYEIPAELWQQNVAALMANDIKMATYAYNPDYETILNIK